MKTIGIIIASMLLLVVCGFQPSDRKEMKLQKEKDMIQLIDSGHFRFVASSARSNLGNFNNLGVNYELVFDSLKLKAYLPYYGRAYSVDYGSDGGVKFDLTAQKIDKKWNNKKKMFTISTEVSDRNDSYSIFLTTSPSGYSDLKINFRNRQMISYYGTIEKIQ
jgi:hypothetical protein